MIRPLPLKFFRLFLLLLLAAGGFYEGFGQACAGADGTGVFTGGAVSTSSGILCANLDTGPGAVIDITVGNIFVGDNVSFTVDWDDGSGSPVLPATQTSVGSTTWKLTSLNHHFPITGPNVKCQYVATVTLLINGTPCISPFGSPPVFSRWNVDSENSGKLLLGETITSANTYFVCQGAETTVSFTDNSTLNCVPPEALPNNTLQRWRRFTYGTANTITGAVKVGGVVVAYPFQDVVINGPAPITTPVPPPNTQFITIPATANVGEEFDIQMEYWNTCNPFPGGTAVTQTARIVVVDQPPTPTANATAPICSGAALPNYSITLPGGFTTSIVTWFQDNAGVPGAVIPGFTGTTLPASAVVPAISSTTPGVYRVWASYFGVNNVQGKSCESARVPVLLTIREDLPIPTIPVLPATVCSTDPPLNITLALPATETNGGATQYTWAIPADIGAAFTPPNVVDLDFSGVTFGGADFVDKVLKVSRRYSSTPNCGSPQQSTTIRIFAPSAKGTTTGGGNFCQGSDAGSIKWTPGRGSIVRWDVSTNGGSIFSDAGLGTSNTVALGTTLAPGSYIYHAVIQNGPCSTINGDNITFNISINPGAASVGLDQALCQALLTSNPLGGNTPPAGTGQWTKVSGPGNVLSFNPSNSTPNATVTVDNQGLYKFKWTVTSGTCVSSADIQVDFGTDPGLQDAGAANSFCSLTGSLAAVAPTIGTGKWTLQSSTPVGTALFVDDSDKNSGVTISGFGTYIFRWTVTSGNCVPVFDDVQLTFNQPATSSVQADFISCVDQATLSPIAITGTTGGGATLGQWIIISGTGNFASSGTSTGSSKAGPTINESYVPTAADFAAGSIKLQLVALDPDGIGPCSDKNSPTLTITIDKKPTNVNAGLDQLLVCSSSTPLTAAAPVDGTGTWTGTGVSFNNPAIRNTTVNGLPLNTTTTLHWTVKSALSSSPGGCSAITDDVDIFRNPLPSVTNLTPPICEETPGTASVVLTDQDNAVTSSAANTSVEWFTDPVPAGPVIPSTTPQILDATVATSLTFFTRVTNSATTCQNTGTVTYTINTLPFVNTSFSKAYCEDFPVGSGKVSSIDLTTPAILNGVAGTIVNRSITWFEDATATTTPIATPAAYSITASTIVYARVKNTITSCENIAPVGLNVTQRPLSQPIQGKAVVCLSGQEAYRVNPVAGATYQWAVPALFTKFLGGGPLDNVALLDFPSVGQDTVRLKITVNGCQSEEIKKSVTVSPTPTPFGIVRADENPALTIATDAVCENDTGIPYAVLPNNFPGSTYNWEVSPLGSALIANGQTSGAVLVNFLSTAAYPSLTIKVTESNTSNCFGVPQSITVTVNPRPELADIAASICSNNPSGITLTTNGAVPAATFNITSVSIDPGLIPTTRATANNVLANAIVGDTFENTTGGALQVRYTVEPVSADGCAGPAKIVSLTVKPQPVLDPFLNVSICSGKKTDVIFKVQVGSVAADQYFIDSITPDPGLVATAGNPVTGTVVANAIADDVWQNLGTIPLNVVYMVRPSNSTLGCTGNPAVPVTVTVYPEPQVTPQTKTICSGDNVNVTLTSNIGTSFSWTVKSVTPGVVGASGGIGTALNDVLTNTSGASGTVTYSVIAKNPASLQSCEGPALDISITVNPAPPVNNVSKTVCSDIVGGSTLPVDLTTIQSAINASPGLNFAWYTDATLTSLISSPATFSMSNNVPVYAKVDNGPSTCFNVASVNYAIAPKPQVLGSAILYNGFEIRCNGDANGQINASASQGTSPYLYSINGGTDYFPVATFNGLSPAAYTIRVKDNNGCINDSPPVPITEPAALTIGSVVTDALCFNGNTGIIQIAPVTGGITGTYTYSLNGAAFQASNTFGSLLAANYTITVKDGNGCTKSSPVAVGQPTQLTGTISSQVNISCNGNNNGSVTVTGSGGTTSSPYQYAIDGLHFQPSGTFNTLVAGSYTISVRDANSCQIPVAVNITEPAVLTLNLTSKIDVACFGTSTGSLKVTAFGGTTPYQYSLDGGTTFQSPSTGIFNTLPGGITYHLLVKDADLCTATLDVTINQPPLFTGFISSQTNVLCNGTATGSVTVSGNGGSGIYQYSKDGGTFGPGGTFSALTANAYIITVKDQNGCTVPVPVAITEPPILTASILTQHDVLCHGGTSGDVTIAAAGGVPPYQYSIDGGIVFNSTGLFSNLAQGPYNVTVRDANLICTTTVPVTISEPLALSVSTVVSPTLCKGEASGQVKITAGGGTPSYMYSIDGVSFQAGDTFVGLATGNYLVRVKDNNACPINSSIVITEPTQVIVTIQSKIDVDCKGNSTGSVTLQATGGNVASYTYSKDDVSYGASPTFAGLPAGNYTFYSKDANGCKAQVNAVISEPAVLSLVLNTKVDVLCNGQGTGSIVVEGAGGTSPYQYSKDGGLFTPLNTFNSLTAKAGYVFTVQDAKNCTAMLSVPIAEPPSIVVNTLTKTDANCFLSSDGSVNITASGGTGLLQFMVLQDPSNITGKTSGVFTGLRAGTYTLQVSDANNCTLTTSSIGVGQPTQLKATANVTSNFNGFGVSCEGASDGVVTGSVTGGTGPTFTYTISPNPNAVSSNTTGIFSGLPTGFYTINVTDAKTCPAASIPVFLSEPFTLSAGFIGFDEFVCVGSDPDIIKEIVTPFGGIGTYTYQWRYSTDNIAFTDLLGANSPSYDPPSTITQTTYFKRVVKSGSCPTVESNVETLTINPLPSATISPSASPICEGNNLFLNLTFTGQAPFRYDYTSVTPSGTVTNFPNLIGSASFPIPVFNFKDTTTYTVTRVKDFNGCESFPNVSTKVDVIKIDPTFTVLAPVAQCTGSTFSFKWKVDQNVKYTWLWPDGQVQVIPANDPAFTSGVITHKFTNGLTSTSIFLPVQLQAESNSATACPTQSVQTAEVYPSVNALIPPVQNVICSGTTLNFDNVTQGASTHKWFYREKGTTNQDFTAATYKVNYQFTNNTTKNPIIYEVIYIGSNSNGCTDSDTLDITVYKNSIASFNEGPIPPYVGGTSTLNITNTSTLIDATDFSYNWNFGEGATPSGYADNATPALPPTVYNSPGSKTIVLTVTNKQQASCKSEFQKTILIPIPPFSAAFTATPLASCLPTEIVVTNLSGKADTFSWELRDFAGNVVAKSNVNQPTFTISSGGTYAIFLTATLLSTSQTATAQITDIEVYERPHAVFDARPNPFFVPDTPIQMFTDNTTGANHYYWDFGDGGTATDEKEPSHTYKLEGSYTITFYASFDHGNKDVNGTGSLENVTCYDTAKLVVKGRQGGQTRIPNAFTPDPSGPNGGNVTDYSRNDVFLPITRGVEEFEMQIYDRWGTMVFVSKDKNQGWDGYDRNGSLLPAGVYVFKLTMRLSNGQRTTQVGDVTLLR